MNTSIVTKQRHPGRVAQGHKLAALMKQRKEELMKQNKKSEQETEQSTEQHEEQSSVISSSSFYGIGAAITLAVGIAVVFLWKRNTPNATSQPTMHLENDIFRMN